jgi:hypothetical protein
MADSTYGKDEECYKMEDFVALLVARDGRFCKAQVGSRKEYDDEADCRIEAISNWKKKER